MNYIHQIWFQGKDHIPEKFMPYRKSWEKYHPNTTILLWDEEKILNLISSKFPRYLRWFQSLPLMIQKIDIAKYFILWYYGGAYVDMDMEALKSIDPIYDSKRIVAGEIGQSLLEYGVFKIIGCSYPLINNGIIFSPPRHSFWERYINRLTNIISDMTNFEKAVSTFYVMKTSGPISFTKALHELTTDKLILPPKYLEPAPFEEQINDEQFILHHHTLSWTDAKNIMKFWNWIQKWWILILIIIIFILFKMRR